MTLKVPDVGELKLMNIIGDAFLQVPPNLKLYVNDKTPTDADVVGDYDEATFNGYSDIVLDGWGAAATVAGKAVITHPQETFTATQGSLETPYGYFVTDASDLILLWAERFTAPITIEPGTEIKVTPRLSGRTEF